jgi:uncharacterized protein (DUF1330 family)
MKANYKIAIALVAGAVLGGAAVEALHAQATPPTYFVADISAITDAEGFKAAAVKAGSSPAAFGGKFIIRTENITALQEAPPKRFVVIEFENLAKAQEWRASAAAQEVNAALNKTTKQRQFFAEGMPQ